MELKSTPFGECFDVANVFTGKNKRGVGSDAFKYSGTVQFSVSPCIGPGDILPSSEPELLMYNYAEGDACELRGNTTLAIKVGFACCACCVCCVCVCFEMLN